MPNPLIINKISGAPRVIRTPDLRIRSPSLYPAELWAHGFLLPEIVQNDKSCFLSYLLSIRRAIRFCSKPVATRKTTARSNSKVEMAGSIGSIS